MENHESPIEMKNNSGGIKSINSDVPATARTEGEEPQAETPLENLNDVQNQQ